MSHPNIVTFAIFEYESKQFFQQRNFNQNQE